MLHSLLVKIRLSYFFAILFIVFLLLADYLPRYTFTSGALTLFSVNSFLYGFYISPILSAQKGRIEELHKIVRAEANVLFAVMLQTKDLPDKLRTEMQSMLVAYTKSSTHNDRAAAEEDYEQLITYCLEYDGKEKEVVGKVLDKLVTNQQNRTMLAMQLNNKVYSNEWMIILMLFSITLAFILLLDTGSNVMLRIVTALLCTGLTMLLIILAKLSTLTHKKATQIWVPFQKLLTSRFYRID